MGKKSALRITGGELAGRRLAAFPAVVRPVMDRTRTSLFATLGPETVSGARVLDLFAGSGALSLEALSRGAAYACMCDRDRQVTGLIRQGMRGLGIGTECYTIHTRAAELHVKIEKEQYDIIFVDPPFRYGYYRELLGNIGTRGLLRQAGVVVVHHQGELPWGEGDADADGRTDESGALRVLRTKRYGAAGITILS